MSDAKVKTFFLILFVLRSDYERVHAREEKTKALQTPVRRTFRGLSPFFYVLRMGA